MHRAESLESRVHLTAAPSELGIYDPGGVELSGGILTIRPSEPQNIRVLLSGEMIHVWYEAGLMFPGVLDEAAFEPAEMDIGAPHCAQCSRPESR